MAVDPARFRAAMARFPGAVTIITTRAGGDAAGERRGITATAVCSVTADPPSLLICVNRATGTCAGIQESGLFNVNLLPDPSHELAMRFAGVGGVTGPEKFALGDWRADHRGLPVLAEACLGFCCEVSESLQAGTHQIFIGRIVEILQAPGAALVYEQSRFHRLEPI